MIIPITPVVNFSFLYPIRDAVGRTILGTALCGNDYGSDIVLGQRTYPVMRPLFPNYTFVPLPFVRNNFHFLDYNTIEFNNYFVKNWFIDSIDLHAVLLSRNGGYGFSTWRQLQWHSLMPQVRYLKENGLLSYDINGSYNKIMFEGPVYGNFSFSGGLVGRINNSSKDAIFTDIQPFQNSFGNETVMFNSDSIVLKGVEIQLSSPSLEIVKEKFFPVSDGKKLQVDTFHTILLRHENPEKITREVKMTRDVQLGRDGALLNIEYSEVIFPDRFVMYKKGVRVREKFLVDKSSFYDDKKRSYFCNWSDRSDLMLRRGDVESCFLDIIGGNYIGPRARWCLTSIYYGGERQTSSLRATDEELGELNFCKFFNSGGTFYASPRFSSFNRYFFGTTQENRVRDFCYRVDKQIGYSPTYDSYEDYVSDLKIKAQNYSLIPDRDGLVDGVNEILLKNKFYESDGFCVMKKFEGEKPKDLRTRSITVELQSLVKIWLKRGFFPAERIVQLASLMYDQYKDVLSAVTFTPKVELSHFSSSSYASNVLQTFVEFVFAPGVLLNSIKSGVAVGYPIYNLKVDVNGKQKFYDIHYSSNFNLNMLLGTIHDRYLNFESLFDLEGNLGIFSQLQFEKFSVNDKKIPVYASSLAPFSPHEGNDTLTTKQSFCLSGKISGEKYFEKACHNYVAEIINFYLKKGKTTSFESKKESEFLSAEAGVVYYMDVVLRKQKLVLCEGYSTESHSEKGGIYGSPLCADKDLPIEITLNNDLSYANRLTQDPAYAPFTPPYFYGDAVARLSFDPMEADTSLKVGEVKKFSLEEILSNVRSRLYGNTRIFGVKSDESGNKIFIPRFDEEKNIFDGVYNTINWLNYYDVVNYEGIYDKIMSGEIPGQLFVSGTMPITQSVDLFSKKRVLDESYSYSVNRFNKILYENKENEYKWCIELKFETPILDFSMHTINDLDKMPEKVEGEYVYNEHGGRARGLWFDYGVEPEKDSGLFLELRESFVENFDESTSVFNINEEIFEKCFASEPALYLFWEKSFYEFDVDVSGFPLTVYLVSNFDTDVVFSYVGSCSDGSGHSFEFVDTTWLTGRSIKKGVVYNIELKSFSYGICISGLSKFTTIQAISSLATSRNCILKLKKSPDEGCEITSTVSASSYFLLQDLVRESPLIYESLFNYYVSTFSLKNRKKYGSLLKLCGFTAGSKKIGEIKENALLKEGIVVVPFIEKSGSGIKEYFLIDKKKIEEQLDNFYTYGYSHKTVYGDVIKETEIVSLVRKMEEYWFPEKYDFVHYNVPPRVMFFFEISKRISKQDLIDLWQNILPKSLRKVEEIKIKKEYLLEEYEILGGVDLPVDVKFEVFSVPVRALQEYEDILPSKELAEKKTKVQHNWPYSFLRLSEYAKVTVGKKYEL